MNSCQEAEMCRNLLVVVLLLVSAGSLHAQTTAGQAPDRDEAGIEVLSMRMPEAGLLSLTAARSGPFLPPPHRVLALRRDQAGMNCPQRPRAFLTGAVIGLLVGGMTGYALADRLPNPGVGDVPPEAVYVPLFAI